ncbi:MAG: hypothetical protein ACQESS_03280 [Bacillota bacterium]
METIIFVLPVLLIFLFVIINFFLIFKKIITFILKSAEKNRGQNRSGIDSQQPVNSDVDLRTIVDNDRNIHDYAEEERNTVSGGSMDVISSSSTSVSDSDINTGASSDFGSDFNSVSGSDSDIFGQFASYTEVEKAVLYNEIMGPPKAYENEKKIF